MMARNSDGELEEQSTEGYQEAAFEAFMCLLTKQVMQDPVTIETGQTFEREAILKWFRSAATTAAGPPARSRSASSAPPTSTSASPSATSSTSGGARNDEKDLDKACNALRLHLEDDEDDTLRAMAYISQRYASGAAPRRTSCAPRASYPRSPTCSRAAAGGSASSPCRSSAPSSRTMIRTRKSWGKERIGAVYGAILLLVGMGSSKSENMMAVEKAEKTLKNLEKYDTNIKQMVENGRLQPLLTKLLQVPRELCVGQRREGGGGEQVGTLLVSIIKTGGLPAREATLASCRRWSRTFSVGASSHFPMRLKEVSATILANLTLLSEDVVHSLLHLISNTGPAVECKLLNVLVGLTSSPDTAQDVVSAIKSSGATISLIQFLEAAHRDPRGVLKLLRNVSPYMGAELADARRPPQQLAPPGLLGDLSREGLKPTRQLFELGAFGTLSTKLAEPGGRHPREPVHDAADGGHGEGDVQADVLQEAPEYVEFAREAALAPLFVELVQVNGQDATRNLTVIPDPPAAGAFRLPVRVLRGAIVDGCCCCWSSGGGCAGARRRCWGKAVERLVACLDHLNPEVVEAALAALATLVGGRVEAAEGVLGDADGLRPVVDILVENRTEKLRRRAVWVVERILRVEDIAQEVAADQTVASALVEAYRNGDPHPAHRRARPPAPGQDPKLLQRVPCAGTPAMIMKPPTLFFFVVCNVIYLLCKCM
ncbi:hypothetical protein ZWY2020_048498 [Hordeum vulgare]|nr:hypothetical protein ZWY2020_048498 [Hordeum vulgare]